MVPWRVLIQNPCPVALPIASVLTIALVCVGSQAPPRACVGSMAWGLYNARISSEQFHVIQDVFGSLYNLRVLVVRALLFGVHIRCPRVLETPISNFSTPQPAVSDRAVVVCTVPLLRLQCRWMAVHRISGQLRHHPLVRYLL